MQRRRRRSFSPSSSPPFLHFLFKVGKMNIIIGWKNIFYRKWKILNFTRKKKQNLQIRPTFRQVLSLAASLWMPSSSMFSISPSSFSRYRLRRSALKIRQFILLFFQENAPPIHSYLFGNYTSSVKNKVSSENVCGLIFAGR